MHALGDCDSLIDSGTTRQWTKVANIHQGVQNGCMTDALRIDMLCTIDKVG